MSEKNKIEILLLAASAGTNSLFRPESRTGFSKDRWAIPPLGLYRIGGYLMKDETVNVEVYDSYVDTEEFLVKRLKEVQFDIVGFSLTHQTLENDLYFMHLAKRVSPSSVLIMGGDEATFNYKKVMDLAPIDYTVLGEGEKPMKEMCNLLKNGSRDFSNITGLIYRDGKRVKNSGPNYAMSHAEFEEATFAMDFADIPYERYWDRIESFYTKYSLIGDRDTELNRIEDLILKKFSNLHSDEVDWAKDDTLATLYKKCFEISAEVMLLALEKFSESDLSPGTNKYVSSYYSFPTKEHWLEFRTRGGRFI